MIDCSMSDDGFCKCRYQTADDCLNWTNEGLTLGTSQASMGPPDARGFPTKVDYPSPICSACLAGLTTVCGVV